MLAAQTHDRADKPAGAEPERADAAPAMRGAPLLPSLRPTPAPLPSALQRKLTVGDPDDAYEAEADSVAERVMRMPDTTLFLRRKCNCGGECEECGAGAPRLMRLASDRAGAGETAPPVVSEVLASPGRPLDAATREFMEPRLGLDLGGVRVHTGGRAAESARAVGALAYTVGRDIVFGLGQYAPDSGAGRKLLAHELAHVAQQSGGAPVVRRACAPGRKGIGAQEPASKCAPGDPLFVHGPRLKFCTDSDELLEGQDKLFDDWRAKASAASSVELHGNASTEGPSGDYNLKLSCHRAAAMAVKLASAGVSTPATLHAHGATAVYGDALENRNVVLVTKAPVKKEEPKGEEKQEPKEKEKEPPKGTNQLDDCKEDAGQPASIRAAVSRALGDLDTAISALAARPLTDHAKNSLFIVLRASDDATADTILERLRKIRKGLPSVLITCDQKDKIITRCGGETAAFTNTITGTIHLCMEDWDKSSVENRAHTLIHEGAHAFAGAPGAGEVYYSTGSCEDSEETAGLSPASRLPLADATACVAHHLARRPAEDVKATKELFSGEALKQIVQVGKGAISLAGPQKKPAFIIDRAPVVVATNVRTGGGFTFRWRLFDDQDRHYLMRSGDDETVVLDWLEFTGTQRAIIGTKTRELLASRNVTKGVVECTVRVPESGEKTLRLRVEFTP